MNGSTIYAGGYFNTIGGQTRHIAALDANTGLPTTWNPNANNVVRALIVSGTTVYAGGYFTNIGGQTRSYIAALSSTSGNATAWNPIANSGVYTLAVSGSTVYAGRLHLHRWATRATALLPCPPAALGMPHVEP